MHDNPRILENRITRELIERIFPAEVVERLPLDVTSHELPGEPPFPGGPSLLDPATFEPVPSGTRWGRPWGTTWFHVVGDIPEAPGAGSGLHPDRLHTEVVAELGFIPGLVGFQAEGAVYVDGRLRCGIHPERRSVPLEVVGEAGRVDFHIEGASNPDFTQSFTASPLGSLDTAGDAPLYTFGGVSIVVVDAEVRALIATIGILNEAMRSLPRDSARRKRLEYLFQRAYDMLDPAAVRATAPAVRGGLAEAFEAGAAPDAHRLSAVGHAHIDSAWLWPLRETRRKCARTFSNQIQLMETYPEHRFACSQALQYQWVETDHPELFSAIERRVGDGRWIPVGGMWVEADMNLPSGESIVRQLVHGQRYFESRFGIRCREIWIPDVFGYPGNLPQIFRSGGCDRFVTQKLSWNKTNRIPHHTFIWEGIDGSEVLAHFPPIDTYNAEIRPRELMHAASNFSDHAWSDHSLVPFGHGDGGGGPTREMLDRARVLGDLSGLPRLTIEDPGTFFDRVEGEAERRGAPRWRGELYFEMHRGTFTTQAKTKVGNRRCEDALFEAELWLATLDDSRADELDQLWKRVLTQQFHDIIPGSSIAWVHKDAEQEHAEVMAACNELTEEALTALAPSGPAVLNPGSHDRADLVVDEAAADGGPSQVLSDGRVAYRASAPGLGLAPAAATAIHHVVELETAANGATRLANGLVQVEVASNGDVTSIRDLRVGRELLPVGAVGAHLTLAPDVPVEYDAWDLEQWTAARAVALPDAASVEVAESGPLLGTVRVRREFGRSWVEQTIALCADSARIDLSIEVDWHEDEKLLAIEFPLDVRAERAACEVQFGHEFRPTHRNTSWDDAKFEVCAQRWVDVSEAGFGVAVLNDGRHGHAFQDGGVRVSLLRAPRYPDPTADRGRHHTTLSLLPHSAGLAEVICEAEALNRPMRVFRGGTSGSIPAPAVSVSDPRVQVSAVKLADDDSGDLVVRVWEAVGDRVRSTVTLPGGIASITACNALEEAVADGDGPEVELSADVANIVLRPFSVATLRLAAQA